MSFRLNKENFPENAILLSTGSSTLDQACSGSAACFGSALDLWFWYVVSSPVVKRFDSFLKTFLHGLCRSLRLFRSKEMLSPVTMWDGLTSFLKHTLMDFVARDVCFATSVATCIIQWDSGFWLADVNRLNFVKILVVSKWLSVSIRVGPSRRVSNS